MKHLEDEKKQLQDWEARFAFTKDMQANMEVCSKKLDACMQL